MRIGWKVRAWNKDYIVENDLSKSLETAHCCRWTYRASMSQSSTVSFLPVPEKSLCLQLSTSGSSWLTFRNHIARKIEPCWIFQCGDHTPHTPRRSPRSTANLSFVENSPASWTSSCTSWALPLLDRMAVLARSSFTGSHFLICV